MISDPKAAIARITRMDIPASINIRIIEEKENEVCLLIPFAKEYKDEISYLELEAVAGGWTATPDNCIGSPQPPETQYCDKIL